MSLACVPDDVEDIILSNPIGYEFLSQAPVYGVRPVIVDDLAEVADALYSGVKEFGVKILLAHLKFEDFQFLHGLRLFHDT